MVECRCYDCNSMWMGGVVAVGVSETVSASHLFPECVGSEVPEVQPRLPQLEVYRLAKGRCGQHETHRHRPLPYPLLLPSHVPPLLPRALERSRQIGSRKRCRSTRFARNPPAIPYPACHPDYLVCTRSCNSCSSTIVRGLVWKHGPANH